MVMEAYMRRRVGMGRRGDVGRCRPRGRRRWARDLERRELVVGSGCRARRLAAVGIGGVRRRRSREVEPAASVGSCTGDGEEVASGGRAVHC